MRRKTTIVMSGGGWSTNIGNAFVDLGSIYTLSRAFEEKESNIILSSNFPKAFLFRGGLSHPGRILDGSITDRASKLFDVRDFIKADYIVFSGDLLRERWWKITPPDKLLKKNRGIRIIINGGGGSLYTEREFETVRDFLNKMDIYAFIARDEKVFKEYKGIAEHSFNGIDCAFFINNCFEPPILDLHRYITFTFDKSKEPKLHNEKRKIIKMHHTCWSQSGGFLKWIYYKHKQNSYNKNTFVSDLPDDYLTIYANTEETHADLVHACVPTLAFGKPAKFYNDSPRGAIFDRVDVGTIRNKLTSLNQKKIEKEKERHIKFLTEILE